MKNLATILNFILLGLTALIFTKSGNIDGEELLYFSVMTVTAILNLLTINKKGIDVVSLIYKRKILEEKKRISDLENKNN